MILLYTKCMFPICRFFCISFNIAYLRFSLRGIFIMFCILPGSLNNCSVVFLNDAKCSKFKNVNKQKMDDIGEAIAVLGLARPPTRPRPAGSGSRPVSCPALPGSQAGWLGGAPGLPPGPGRLPGRPARGHARPPARPWPAPRPACLRT